MYAIADALVEPDWRDRGLLDTALVVGAVRQRRRRRRPRPASRPRTATTCAARCSARAAWPRWATGAAPAWRSPAPAGRRSDTVRSDQELLRRRLRRRAGGVRRRRPRAGRRPPVDGRGRPGRAGDRAGRGRVGAGRPPGARSRRLAQVTGWSTGFRLAASAEMVFLDLPFEERVRRIADARLRGRDLGLDEEGRRRAGRTGATFSSMTGYITGTLADPDGAAELLRTAEESLRGGRAARLPAAERARHRPGRPGPAGARRAEVVTPAMWLHAARR